VLLIPSIWVSGESEAAHLQPKQITKYAGLRQMLDITTGQILTSEN
jgi:hypothetical protein